MKERPKRTVKLTAGQVCPLCREGAEKAPLAVCPRCQTLLHDACVRELAGGRCPTPGCAPAGPRTSAAAATAPAAPHDPLPCGHVPQYRSEVIRRPRRSQLVIEHDATQELIITAALLATIPLALLGAWLVPGMRVMAYALGGCFGLGMGGLGLVNALYRRRNRPRLRLDRARATWELSRGQGRPDRRPLGDLQAVQLVFGYEHHGVDDHGRPYVYPSYQLCWVWSSGERELYLSGADLGELRRLGKAIASFAAVPLHEHSERPSNPQRFQPAPGFKA